MKYKVTARAESIYIIEADGPDAAEAIAHDRFNYDNLGRPNFTVESVAPPPKIGQSSPAP